MAKKVLKWSLSDSIGRVKKAFMAGVDSVQPNKLITRYIQQEDDQLIISGKKYPLKNNVYIVGFGKAVGSMIQPLSKLPHLQKAILSVPYGWSQKTHTDIDTHAHKRPKTHTEIDKTHAHTDTQAHKTPKTHTEIETHTNIDETHTDIDKTRTEINKTHTNPNKTHTNINTTPPHTKIPAHIEILEGAKNNIPDPAAFDTSRRIVSLIQSLSEDTLVLVLISGGGSALLPYPRPPLTLEEKIEVIRSLSRAGARITELNMVRKALSEVKGGRLALKTGAKIVTFILSDIVGSPLDMIASGPTVPNLDRPGAAAGIVKKYKLDFPKHIMDLLEGDTQNSKNPDEKRSKFEHTEKKPSKNMHGNIKTDENRSKFNDTEEKTSQNIHGNFERPGTHSKFGNVEEKTNELKNKSNNRPTEFSHVTNLIIGDNRTALLGAQESFGSLGQIKTIILSSSVQGEARVIGKNMAELAMLILKWVSGDGVERERLNALLVNLSVDTVQIETLRNSVEKCQKDGCGLGLIFGGETTVSVKGKGIGGRNQEMVLAASIALEQNVEDSGVEGDIVFVSGGTDGIDGPTDAAGAITFWSQHNKTIKSQIQEAQKEGLDAEKFLEDNDSYSYFNQLKNSEYLLKPGHTGTNVMDLHILLIIPH